jgi:hypothetical protein
MKNWLHLGDYNAICDSCGRKFKASTMLKRWDGLFVCKEDWEPKHPQLFIRVHGDRQIVPTPRPPAPDQFLGNVCNFVNSQGVAGLGIAGCMIAGKTSPAQII